jgi:ribosomal protein S18 acetylase RimI-like enzyme
MLPLPGPAPDPLLRRATSEDVPAIVAVVASAYGRYAALIGRTPKPMLADQGAAVRDHEVWVLEAGLPRALRADTEGAGSAGGHGAAGADPGVRPEGGDRGGADGDDGADTSRPGDGGASREGAIVGVIDLVPADDHLWVENVAIAPAWQHRGLGRRLLRHAEERALGLGYDEIRLLTNERYTQNIAMYGRYGYRETHRTPYLGTDLVHFRKQLGVSHLNG